MIDITNLYGEGDLLFTKIRIFPFEVVNVCVDDLKSILQRFQFFGIWEIPGFRRRLDVRGGRRDFRMNSHQLAGPLTSGGDGSTRCDSSDSSCFTSCFSETIFACIAWTVLLCNRSARLSADWRAVRKVSLSAAISCNSAHMTSNLDRRAVH